MNQHPAAGSLSLRACGSVLKRTRREKGTLRRRSSGGVSGAPPHMPPPPARASGRRPWCPRVGTPPFGATRIGSGRPLDDGGEARFHRRSHLDGRDGLASLRRGASAGPGPGVAFPRASMHLHVARIVELPRGRARRRHATRDGFSRRRVHAGPRGPDDALAPSRATHRPRRRRRGLFGRRAAEVRAGPRSNDLGCCGLRPLRGAARRRLSITCGDHVPRAIPQLRRPPRSTRPPGGAGDRALEQRRNGNMAGESHLDNI